ncbi:hypothetical protein ACIQRK_20850 [Streptomyces anulatus]
MTMIPAMSAATFFYLLQVDLQQRREGAPEATRLKPLDGGYRRNARQVGPTTQVIRELSKKEPKALIT